VSTGTETGKFAERVGLELNRAARYHFFVSFVVFDFSVFGAESPCQTDACDQMQSLFSVNTRKVDEIAILGGERLAVLLPETSRQGAEIVSRRLSGIVSEQIKLSGGKMPEAAFHVEIASYPDAAGVRPIVDYLKELAPGEVN
jgi:GGDEF domain-containing protein